MAELRTGTQYPGGGNIYFKLAFDTNLNYKSNLTKFYFICGYWYHMGELYCLLSVDSKNELHTNVTQD